MYQYSSVAKTKKNFFFEEFSFTEDFEFSTWKTTTRSQKRKVVAELVSGDFETPVNENIPSEDLVAGPIKSLRVEPENLDEIKTSLRKEILSDLSKILAENQKAMLKLIAPLSRKRPTCTND